MDDVWDNGAWATDTGIAGVVIGENIQIQIRNMGVFSLENGEKLYFCALFLLIISFDVTARAYKSKMA